MTFFGPWVDAHSDTLVQSRSLRDPCPHKTAFRSENRLFGMIRATPVGGGRPPTWNILTIPLVGRGRVCRFTTYGPAAVLEENTVVRPVFCRHPGDWIRLPEHPAGSAQRRRSPPDRAAGRRRGSWTLGVVPPVNRPNRGNFPGSVP